MHFWIDGRSQVSGRRVGARAKRMVTPVHRFQAVEPLSPPSVVAGRLKCGVWAACALATVLLAGAKLCASSGGNGMEAAAICALLALVLLAGCAVSLCGAAATVATPSIPAPPILPSSPPLPPPVAVPTTTLLHTTVVEPPLSPAPSPPPYHIAVLLPPPPPYDKVT